MNTTPPGRRYALEDLHDEPGTRAALKGKRVRIWSGEHKMWWRHQSSGYATSVEDAGNYDFEDALDRVCHCRPEKAIVIELIN